MDKVLIDKGSDIKQKSADVDSYIKDAVVAKLGDRYDGLSYVSITENAKEDPVTIFRLSQHISRFIPNWGREIAFYKRLKLLADYFVHPDDRDYFLAQTRRDVILKRAENEQTVVVNFRSIVDSKHHDFQMSFTPDRDEEGKIIGVVVGLFNNDEVLKVQRDAIIFQKAIMQDIVCVFRVSFTRDIVYFPVIQMEEGKEVDISKRFGERIESLQELIRRTAERDIHANDREKFRNFFKLENIKSCFENGESNPSIVCRTRNNKAGLWNYERFACYINKDDYNDDLYGICVAYDANVEVIRQKKLEEAKEEAESANRAKSAFLFNMSHDIRTPMNAIIGFTNLAKQSTDDPEQTGQYLEKILMSSNHLLSLINDVLEMSRIESGKIELDNSPCNLTQIMEDSAEMVRNLAESKNQDLSIDLSKLTDESIICDELRLKQILLNLLSNAVKYTPDNGRIEFSALEKDTAAPQRKIYEFHVKDNGIGMSPEFAARVFEAFEREKNSTVSGIQGTGLGMTITRKIVDMMGGTIDVDTAPGKGTEFTVVTEFEITSEDTRRPKAKPAMSTETDFSGKRLLLVDDMPTNREIAKAILRKIGFIVEEAFDGSQAVSMVEASAPGYYDAVLMDIQMPVMNGYEAAKKIRLIADQKLASIPILAMTANAFDEDRKRALEAGMNGHVAKPINIKALMD